MRQVQVTFVYDPAFFIDDDLPTSENAEILEAVAVEAGNLAGKQEGYDIYVNPQEGQFGARDMVGNTDYGGWNQQKTAEIVDVLFKAFIDSLHRSWEERE